VYASERASETAQHALEAKGVTVIRAPGERPALSFVLSDLAARGATSLLVEGGSTVLGSFLDEGLAHKVCAFVAPSLMGGTDSKPAFGGRGAGSLGAMTQLTDLHLRRRGSATLVVGYPGPRVRPDPGGAA
jgi:diaminohydroxyphosphoribosylaminopyrimidine deaminase/5-amino-6-(5-phosphoribosylamino)uracil reductase